MRIDFVNPFIESAFLILTEVLNCEIKRGDIVIKDQSVPTSGVSTFIGLAGEVEGRIMLDMTKETAINITSVMAEEKCLDVNPLVESVIDELNNLITGHAVSYLTNLGFRFDLTPPSFLLGLSDSYITDIQTLVIPLETSCGVIDVNISIKERY